jgi:hypothetical protein
MPPMVVNEVVEIAIHTLSVITIHLFEIPINGSCSLTYDI